VLSIVVSSVFECVLYGFISSLALLVLLPQFISFIHFLSFIGYLIIFLILLANIMIMLTILIQRVFIFLFLSTTFLFFVSAATAFLVDKDMSSSFLNTIIINNPLTMLVFDIRMLIFFGDYQSLWIIISIVISFFWFAVNGFLLKRKLKQ